MEDKSRVDHKHLARGGVRAAEGDHLIRDVVG
jgi:hypothetical protein